MSEHFDRFMEGWDKGNVELLLSACAEDFVFDDAIDGRFTKAKFPAYFESLAKVGRDGVHSQRVTYYAREPHIASR